MTGETKNYSQGKSFTDRAFLKVTEENLQSVRGPASDLAYFTKECKEEKVAAIIICQFKCGVSEIWP